MASQETVDFEKLLAPIPGDQPGGVELRDSPAVRSKFFALKSAREEARRNERKAALPKEEDDKTDWWREARKHWTFILTNSPELLADHSKDLWVATWYLEGLVREHGFAGLRDGFRLVRELIETFWEDIHPRPDEDGYRDTLLYLDNLDNGLLTETGEGQPGALIEPILWIPLSATEGLRGIDFYEAFERVTSAGSDESRAALRARFEAVQQAPNRGFYEKLLALVDACLQELDALAKVLDEKCSRDASGHSIVPTTSGIRELLDLTKRRIRRLAGIDEFTSVADTASDASGSPPVANPPTGSLAGGGSMSREAAFQSLRQIAEFFRRTEPHSPISYALEQCVRWGRMSLPELLRELIADDTARSDLYKRTGIHEQKEGE